MEEQAQISRGDGLIGRGIQGLENCDTVLAQTFRDLVRHQPDTPGSARRTLHGSDLCAL